MNFAAPQWGIDAEALPNDQFVHLAQVAQDASLPLTLVFFTEAPGLRYQLNANHLLQLPWWRAFDAIQDIPVTEGLPLDVSDVIIPAGSDLVYNGSDVLIVRGDQYLGTVKRRHGGVWQVIWPTADGRQVDQYDDRGFLSTRTWYAADNHVVKKEWLDITGHWVLRQTTDIVVAPHAQARFEHTEYPTIQRVVGEFAKHYFQKAGEPGTLVLTADIAPEITAQLPETMAVHYFITPSRNQRIPELASTATSLIVATHAEADQLKTEVHGDAEAADTTVRVIPPFSTSLRLGRSNEVAAIITYWHVNGLNETERAVVFDLLLAHLASDEEQQLIVDADNQAQIEEFQRLALAFAAPKHGVALDSPEFAQLQALLASDEPPEAAPIKAVTEMTEADERVAVAGVSVSHAADEAELAAIIQHFLDRAAYQVRANNLQITQDFETVRLLVDLGQPPDLFMQIEAISTGIPQVNRTATDYVITGENGRIIAQLGELTAALHDYLDSLTQWNKALVVNAQLIDQYSEARSQALWREVLING